MADMIEKIPEKTRWEIATKGLTGAYIAISKALKQAVGQKQFEEFNLAQASMGPEFVFEVVESTKDRCVGKTSQCPWHKRWKEQGVDFNTCGVGHQKWGEGAAESLNPNFTFKLTKNMLLGDAYCEWVVERKK